MYGKIIGGRLEIAGYKIKIKNGWITNPTEEQLIANGYKEVIKADEIKFDEETEKIVTEYRETENTIEIVLTKETLTKSEIENKTREKTISKLDDITQIDILKAIVGDKEAILKIEEVVKAISSSQEEKEKWKDLAGGLHYKTLL